LQDSSFKEVKANLFAFGSKKPECDKRMRMVEAQAKELPVVSRQLD
jgi:hypothetical protein